MRSGSFRAWRRGATALGLALVLGGCIEQEPPKPAAKYETLPPKVVPEYAKGSILEKTDLVNTQPFTVSAYGLVSRLRGTGGSQAPSAVRDFMVKEMLKRGFGRGKGVSSMSPETILADNHFAIVHVDGSIPPGARKGQAFDVMVSALPESGTSSLSHGVLFQTNLYVMGGDPSNPGGNVNDEAVSEGPIFVNPGYALSNNKSSAAKTSLRYGIIMDGGVASKDRELILRLREPQSSMTRQIQYRINQRFQKIADSDSRTWQGAAVAFAQDEAIINMFTPKAYHGDWEHFAKLATHLYMFDSPEFATLQARKLADEAVKKDAKLEEISYFWEGLGQEALPAIEPLMAHENQDVAFYATRAAAFLNDPAAVAALYNIAKTPNHQYQVNAVTILGSLPATQQINGMLRNLMFNATQTMVRIEAYKQLTNNPDPVTRDHSVISQVVNEKFVLDLVPSDGPPLIYASRTGTPRMAVLGKRAKLDVPLVFTAMERRLMIASGKTDDLTIFYRPPLDTDMKSGQAYEPTPISIQSSADLAEIIARLGGEAADDAPKLDFSYGDIVAIVQQLADGKKLSAATNIGKMPAAFVLQDVAGVSNLVYNAPVIISADTTNPAALPDLDPKAPVDSRTIDGGNTGRPQ